MVSLQHTAASIAKAIHAKVEGPSDIVCSGVASLEEATSGDLTFMVNAKYTKKWKASNATIGIVPFVLNYQIRVSLYVANVFF